MDTEKGFALTSIQASNELHVSIGTLLRWVHEGRIPACKIGDRKYLFSAKTLEALIISGNLSKKINVNN